MRISLTKEIGVVTQLSLAGLRQRWRRMVSALIATAGVVAVFVSVISIAQGYREVVSLAEDTGNVMVLMNGATSEIVSTLSAEQTSLIKQSAMVAHDASQAPVASAEVLTTYKIPKRDGSTMSISVRGVEPAAHDLRKLRIAQGRDFVPGRHEAIIGRRLLEKMPSLRVGDQLHLGSAMWTVVGIFEAASGLTESELWTDAATLQSAKQQGNNYSVMYLRLADGVDIKAFEKKLADDPRINPQVVTENEYVTTQSNSMTRFVEIIGYFTTTLMALGAIFAALNTSNASVVQRSKEFATLKALGFRDHAILTAVLVESLLLAVAAGLVATLACYWVFDGYTVSTILGSHSYSAVVFSFKVAPLLMVQAIGIAAAIGVIGALYPSLTILTLPVTRALARRQ